MLTISRLSASYELGRARVQALRSVDLTVGRGAFFVLLGPSGCGKTTMLRAVAGLERPTDGSIVIDGRTVFDGPARTFEPPERRPIAMVFQSYAIWPHMSVRENVEFPLARGVRPMAGDKRRQRVDEALEILRLTAYADRSVTTLSGGQQQRVAIARAIALQPKILLMDEPLSNLDYALQTRLRSELRELFKGLGLTVLYVTHNQTEAMEIADSMAVMHEGQIEQIGPPEAIYNRPASEFVARFMGETNLVPIATFDEAACRAGTPFGWVTLDPSTCGAPRVGGSHSLAFRPESLRLGAAVGNTTPITGTVLQRFYQGPSCLYTIEASGCRLRLRFGPEIRLAIGDTVTFSLQGADCRIVATDDLSPAPESP